MRGRRTKIQNIIKDGAIKTNPMYRLPILGFLENAEPDKGLTPLSGSASLTMD
jgi:hypothetical protein